MNGQRAWAVRVTVIATDADIDDITDRLGLALCPDPDHFGRCPNPWEITTTAVDDLDEPDRSRWMATAEELRHQELGESGPICT